VNVERSSDGVIYKEEGMTGARKEVKHAKKKRKESSCRLLESYSYKIP
jgi:hypothetical protein